MNEKLSQIQQTEMEIYELTNKLAALRKKARAVEIKNYLFKDLTGEVSLLELFAGAKTLFAIHNMGQACRYCTLWADGLNAWLPHLEDEFSVVLLSKDKPAVQRAIANDRGWRFRLASHGGGAYIREQTVMPGEKNMPGLVVYQRRGKKILRKNSAIFGPGDLYCSIWNMLNLAGRDASDWTPQFHYWSRPQKMEDGGANVRD